MLQPRESGIQGEDDEAKLLDEVGPVVAAAEMFGFVENDLPEFGGRETGEQPLRNEDARGEKADDAGAVECLRRANVYAGVAEMNESVGKDSIDLDRLRSLPQLPQPDGVCDECRRSNEGSDQPECRDGISPTSVYLEESVGCGGR